MLRKLSKGERRTVAHWAMEFVVVVVGVLLALWLQEWVAGRSAAAKHHELMERLFEESEDDVSAIRDTRDALRPMVKSEKAVAVALAHGKCPADRDFHFVETLRMLPALSVPTSVYQELLGAGGLSSIERKDVRDHVAQFYGNMDWVQKQIEYFRAGRVDPLSYGDPRVSTHFDPAAEEPQVSVFDGKALCRDHEFKNRFAIATRDHSVFASYFEGVLANAISMCVRLGDSLGHTCQPADGGPLVGNDANYAAKVRAQMHKTKPG